MEDHELHPGFASKELRQLVVQAVDLDNKLAAIGVVNIV
jgi:hypothetical protein